MGPRIPHLTVDKEEICWTSSAGAKSYDVVQGGMSALRESGGDFSEVATDCLVKNEQALCTPILDDPSPGEAFWYLVRPAKSAASATYDSGCPSQITSRDEPISDARGSCPPRHAHADSWEVGQVTVVEPWFVDADDTD
jgi:hypothetical protein